MPKVLYEKEGALPGFLARPKARFEGRRKGVDG